MAAVGDLIPSSDDFLEEDDDDDSEGWSEMNVECESNLTCLFCPQQFKTMAVTLEHCKIEHGFDLIELKKRFSMDCYSYFCLVNFVRREGAEPQQISASAVQIWQNDKYLEPALADDPWLMFDFEGLESPIYSRPVSPKIKVENGAVTIDEDSYKHMLTTIHQLRTTLEQQNNSLSMAAEDMETMRKATQNIVSNMNDDSYLDKGIGKLRISEDYSYFSSYSHFGIHHTMLTDKPRTVSYRDAILKNADCVAGKAVLDVGCGSAILSMFCSQAGAAIVVGVDQSDIIYHAMDIVRENGMESKVQLIKGRIEEVTLPINQVDLIVSEWMGYFLLFEGMLDAVIMARDKFLKPGGLMLPSRATVRLFGISDPESYQENMGFWSDVYGYKMTSLRNEVLKEAYITGVNPSTVVTAPALVHNLDLTTCTMESTEFSSEFILIPNRECDFTAIGGYFDTQFELPHSVVLSTSPLAEKTHWRQTVFFLPTPLHVTSGSSISGQISCSRKPDDPRALVIQLQLAGQTNTYFLA